MPLDPSYTYKPPKTIPQRLLRWATLSTAFLIFLPTTVAVLIICFTPVHTGAEEDVMEAKAFLTWCILTLSLLLTTLTLYISSLITYLQCRHSSSR